MISCYMIRKKITKFDVLFVWQSLRFSRLLVSNIHGSMELIRHWKAQYTSVHVAMGPNFLCHYNYVIFFFYSEYHYPVFLNFCN